MHVVLEWVKSNVFIVIFVVLMVASLVGLPLVARGMNAEIAKEVETRGRKLNDLARLEQTQVAAPGGAAAGQTKPALVNEQLLNAFRANVRVAQEDADQVLARAIEHNRKGRGVLMEGVFPAPPPHLAEVMPQRFFERVRGADGIDGTYIKGAYDELLEEVKAGSPPSLEELRNDIERRELQFRTHTLSKDADDPLTDEEREELQAALTGLRLLRYAEAAERISMYASLESLADLPRRDSSRLPSLSEMFEWQWRYWIHEDLLKALYEANKGYPSVVEAPLKHVVWVSVGPSVVAGGRTASGPTGGSTRSGEFGGSAAAPAAAAPNPRTEAPRDFSVSLTGRVTNPLYDVRYVDVDLIIDTNRIPEVLDALSRYNFFTVIRMRTTPADPYMAAASGYYYGSQPVSLISLRLETVWFRQWTSTFMPVAVKQRLGVPVEEASSYN